MRAFPNKNTIIKYAGKFGPIHEKEEIQNGMDLRDYFAGKALQGLLATVKDETWFQDEVASICYEMADKMMKARESK